MNIATHPNFFSDKSIIITGGTGFIGSALVRHFAKKASAVHVLVRKESRLDRIEPVLNSINIHEADLAGETPLTEQLEGLKCDYIFHFAEPASGQLNNIGQFIQAQDLAVKMMANILEYTRESGAEKLIHACSSTVYGKSEVKRVSEKAICKPDTFRGMTKLAERTLCHFYAEQYQTPVVLARIFRAYGTYDHQDRLIERVIESYRKGETIDIVSDEIGRDYIHTDDINSFFEQVCQTDLQPGTELNLGSGNSYTAREIAEKLQELLQANGLISNTPYPLSAIDKTARLADTSKAEELLGWKPQVDLETGLRDILNWHQI